MTLILPLERSINPCSKIPIWSKIETFSSLVLNRWESDLKKVSIFEVFLSVEIELNENRKVMSRYVNIDGFLMIFVKITKNLEFKIIIFIWECFDVAMVNLNFFMRIDCYIIVLWLARNANNLSIIYTVFS